MGAALRDYRALVPRTPPEGLREWTLKTCRSELNRHGLVYEVEYVKDYGLAYLLDEWARPRKTKMVRVTCSCCGESMLLNWGADAKYGYGFTLPDDEEGDWARTVTSEGDEAACPICGEKVLVKKRSSVRNYYVASECMVMSAGVLAGGELVLTGWTVQRWVYKSGSEGLEFIPAEAYVFTVADCAQLMGWRNGYSGKGGYFIEYGSAWRQPRKWSECWGREESIFGLTPELIDRSCLPHCKLDVYMRQSPGVRHYPVTWLRLYQLHPNVEAVLLHGLPRVVHDLIAGQVEAYDWREKNVKGSIELPGVDWAETRPAQMLGLTKEELRMGREQGWGGFFWNLFVGAKRIGERLTAEDMENALSLGDENAVDLIPRRQVGKSIRYLLRQIEMIYAEIDAEGADPVADVSLLLDYWTMAETLGRDLSDPSVKYPEDLIAAHDRAAELMKQKKDEIAAGLFRVRRHVLKKYAFVSGGLLIRPAASQRELTAEGDALHHCVGTYGKRHVRGETAIFFIRRVARARESYFTLELDEKKLAVRQNRGMCNCDPPEEVREFVQTWLEWVRAGAPRDRNGRPLRGEQGVRRMKRGKEAA